MKRGWRDNVRVELWTEQVVMLTRMAKQTNVRAKMSVTIRC